MMGRSHPVHAWLLITSLRLAPILFELPRKIQWRPEQLDRYVRPSAPDVVPPGDVAGNYTFEEAVYSDGMQTVQNLHSVIDKLQGDGVFSMEKWEPDEKRLMRYAAFLAPIAGLQYEGKKGKASSVVIYLLGDRLKLPKRDAERVDLILSVALEYQRLVGDWGEGGVPPPPKTHAGAPSAAAQQQEGADEADGTTHEGSSASQRYRRVDLGLILRKAGHLWNASLMVAMAGAIGRVTPSSPSHTQPTTPPLSGPPPAVPLHSSKHVISSYRAVKEAVEWFGLDGVWDKGPPLDGNAVKSVLPKLPKGPKFKEVMDEQVVWMLGHPEGTADECRAFIKERFADFA
ncbi:unnamed protein product [Vitrella brassicaformis CCMP3155]|uniref:Uncharacterized protein n=2 Tax=Vitrella brassicaformis TaxID=1169539 RepID=A0A0G4FY89_VITBC|nr:unnamed protein product [Vitrella brassicaformis CCMP3155]|eukprot:CEM20320.1 unnamed protein product [Vitrella brassicaformis CCMP3155]